MYLNYIFIVLSIGGTATLYLTKVLKFTSILSYFLPLPIFIGFMILLEALLIIYALISGLFVKKKEYFKVSSYYKWLVDLFLGWLCASARVKTKVIGKEILPKDKKYLIVSNHVSNYDPIILGLYHKKPHIAFLSKESNFHLPVVGRNIRKVGYLPIDRENPKNAMKTILNVSKQLAKDEFCYGVYPEGTRNKSGEGLLEFKSGCFKIAQKAERPIVISVIKGTKNISKNFPWKRTHVELKFVKVLSYEEIKDLSTQEISDIVRNTILENL